MKNEFDKNLTDRGWQSMSRLLDREMPEQRRRRRRFAWWLFALLLLPLAGVGGWWLLGKSKPEKAPPAEKPKVSKPIAEAENAPHPAVVGAPANKHSDLDIPNEVRNLNKSPLLALPSDASASPLHDTAVRLLDEPRDLTTFKKMSNLIPLPVSPQFVENEIKNAPQPSEVTPFAATVKKKIPEPRRWSFGLAAGLASENFSALNGFSAGAAVDWQFAPKWGLRSGLQFAQYRLSSEERPVISLNSDEYTNATGNNVDNLGGGSNPNTSVSVPVYVPVERLRQLEMPLLAWWQPVRPLRVFGGFSTAYNLSAQASEQNYASGQLYYANSQEAKNNLNELAANNLTRWQASWQAGAGVRLGRHFELGAFYKHGLGGNENSADAQSFDPNLPADLMWQPRSAGASHYFLLNGIWFF